MMLTRKGLLFASILFILHFIQYQLLFTDANTTALGPLFILIMSAFIVYLYSYQSFHDTTNPLYQFPIPIKTRVRYEFISIFFWAFATMLFFMALILFFALIVYLTGNLSTGGEETSESVWALLYQIAHHLIIIASIFPLAYVKKTRKRYIVGLGSYALLFIFNVVVLSFATASMQGKAFTLSMQGNITDRIDYLPYVELFVITYLIMSIVILFLAYKKAQQFSAYKEHIVIHSNYHFNDPYSNK